ncbi:MAG: 16S rRNA (adenine(1518)-N(6)/adenine(1519)-N(6))-dimethyltransferase RsmA [bacterium]
MSLSLKETLQKYNIKPNKRLGQNFLINKGILEKIIKTADLSKSDTVIEVGPGLGTLTLELSKNTKKVIAIEKDKELVEALKDTLKDYKNIDIIHNDALKINLSLYKNYKLVANIPYYLTSSLIRRFLETDNPPQKLVLIIQKEVAQRICSKPPRMSLLSVAVQFYAKPKIISYISKNSFWPAPKVDSAIIKITPYLSENFDLAKDDFFQIVKAGFSSPRKQLATNLSKKLQIDKEKIIKILEQINLDPKIRAERLSVEDWKELSKKIT